MQLKGPILLTLWFLFLTGSVYSQDPRLSYKLDTGTCYQLDIDIQQITSSESINSEEINMYSRMNIGFRPDSTDDYGLIHMTVQYSDLLLSMLAPGMGIDINSESGKNHLLSELMDTLQKKRFRLAMFDSGELHSVSGIQEIFEAMAAHPAADSIELAVNLSSLQEAYGSNAFRGFFNLFIAFFPTVQPIKNWTRDLTYYFNTKPVKMVNRYFLSKATDEVIIIQGMGMLNSMGDFSETVSLGLVKSSVSGSQTYDYQIDPESGWLKKCTSRQRVLIETTVVKSSHLPEGLKIPSFTETVFEVKGSVQ